MADGTLYDKVFDEHVVREIAPGVCQVYVDVHLVNEVSSPQAFSDLTQRRLILQVAGRPLTLTGTNDGHLRRDRYDQVAGPVDGLGLGVTHTPARRLLSGFAADGHALVLAGHTHGGQLRVPGLGALVTNCDLERRRARGLSHSNTDGGTGWLHVSAGLGTSPYAPVRLCCRPEATLLELVPGRGVR